jgi:hypothetical protein
MYYVPIIREASDDFGCLPFETQIEDGIVLGGGNDLAAIDGAIPQRDMRHRETDAADSIVIVFDDIGGDEAFVDKRWKVEGPPIDGGKTLAVGQMSVRRCELRYASPKCGSAEQHGGGVCRRQHGLGGARGARRGGLCTLAASTR